MPGVTVTSVDTKDHFNVMVNHNKDNEFHLLLSTEKLIESKRMTLSAQLY